MTVAIRPEQPADADAVRSVVVAAFANPAHGRLVDELRAEPSYRADRALVAVDGDRVVGFVLVTDSPLTAEDGSTGRIATLSPVAVAPDRQGEGIGSALVDAVVARCAADGEPAVALEGDPAFYGRLGFEPAAPHGLVLPLPAWARPEAAQVRPLAGPVPGGRATYAAPFAAFD